MNMHVSDQMNLAPVSVGAPSAATVVGRTLLSAVASVFGVALVLLVILMLPTIFGDAPWEGVVLFVGVAAVIATPHAIMLGFPLLLLLQKRGRVRALPTVLGGFAIGFLPVYLLGAVPNVIEALQANGAVPLSLLTANLATDAIFGAFGACGALASYLTYRWVSRKG